MSLKHVGRIVKNKKRVIVAYHVVPNEDEMCIVINSDTLLAEEHDALMKLVESHTGQSSANLAEAMVRNTMPDGSNMLRSLHRTGKMIKMPQKDVEMTPDTHNTINLRELLEIIASNRKCSISDLGVKSEDGTVPQNTPSQDTSQQVENITPEVLSDEDIARKYRSQAAAMFKEAKRLREQAEELVPTRKKNKKVESAKEKQTTQGSD